MTDASEVVVSDAEIDAFIATIEKAVSVKTNRDLCRKALAVFLARRVPDAMVPRDEEIESECWSVREGGFNACRERVLRGEQ
jgi:hypothetical protein